MFGGSKVTRVLGFSTAVFPLPSPVSWDLDPKQGSLHTAYLNKKKMSDALLFILWPSVRTEAGGAILDVTNLIGLVSL